MSSDTLDNFVAAARYARTRYGWPDLTAEQLAEIRVRHADREVIEQQALRGAETAAHIAAGASPLAAAILELHTPVLDYRGDVICSHCDFSDYAPDWPCATATLALKDT